jgi:hypothetical protein
MLVSIGVGEMFQFDWGYGVNADPKVSRIKGRNAPKLTPDNTYMMVFNHQSQKKAEEAFNKIKEFNILYKAPMAVNTNHASNVNRNTLYVFELK